HLSECGCSYLRLAFLLRQNLAFVDPGLHADHSVRGPSFAESIFNIGAQRVQRQPALQIPFRARDFVSVQAARNSNLDAFASEAQCRIDTLAHSAAESDSFLELQRDRLGNQLSVELRLVDFLDVAENIALGALLQF